MTYSSRKKNTTALNELFEVFGWDDYISDVSETLSSNFRNNNKYYCYSKDGVDTISVDLVGVKKEDISISREGNVLTVTATRKFEDDRKDIPYNFQFRLKSNAVKKGVSFVDGVLKITFVKDESSREEFSID